MTEKKEAFQKDLLKVSSNSLSTNGNNEQIDEDDIITIDDEINETPTNFNSVEGIMDESKNQNPELVKRVEVSQQAILESFKKGSEAFSKNQEKLVSKTDNAPVKKEVFIEIDLDKASEVSSLENLEELDSKPNKNLLIVDLDDASSVGSFSEHPEKLYNAYLELPSENPEKFDERIKSKLNELRENLGLNNASAVSSLENPEELVSKKRKSNRIPKHVYLDSACVKSSIENPKELVSKEDNELNEAGIGLLTLNPTKKNAAPRKSFFSKLKELMIRPTRAKTESARSKEKGNSKRRYQSLS